MTNTIWVLAGLGCWVACWLQLDGLHCCPNVPCGMTNGTSAVLFWKASWSFTCNLSCPLFPLLALPSAPHTLLP